MTKPLPIGGTGLESPMALLAAASDRSLDVRLRRMFIVEAGASLTHRESRLNLATVGLAQSSADIANAGAATPKILAELAAEAVRIRREIESVRVLRTSLAATAEHLDTLEPVAPVTP